MPARVARQGSKANNAHDAVIAQALAILESRLQNRGEALTSPQAVRDYLRLRIAEYSNRPPRLDAQRVLEHEYPSVGRLHRPRRAHKPGDLGLAFLLTHLRGITDRLKRARAVRQVLGVSR